MTRLMMDILCSLSLFFDDDVVIVLRSTLPFVTPASVVVVRHSNILIHLKTLDFIVQEVPFHALRSLSLNFVDSAYCCRIFL